MTIEKKKIAIIGGAPAGLIIGRLLQMKIVDVRVHERDTSKVVRIQ